MRIFKSDMTERGVAVLIAGVSGMLYDQKDFDPKVMSTKDPYSSAPVHAAQTSSILFCFAPSFILDNKKKQIVFYRWVLSFFSVI